RGSKMGPGDGWFHPSQSRFGWKWLAARHDADEDGEVSREEFTGPAEFFDRLDRDHDGVLTEQDFDWSERSPYAQQGRMGRLWFSQIDANSNGRISKTEWEQFFTRSGK